ncbi:unnamed protein product [Spirodela intermedia]|uniref:Uncharacterized protein n=1 Tax=Spirodela intermedia TaxID=51605 RepID=A0A7I8JIW7_SPIIN|nr:unnamed protein product [Spirodela intermedia]CAA6669715.1 unnamed protein product [Spirodela intermedia]
MERYSGATAALSVIFMARLFLTVSSLENRTSTPLAPALIAFGDSIVDPGNNNVLTTVVKCNFPPYGQDFVGSTPTGRFCNGKIPTDFLAAKMGIKEYLPPYLGSDLTPEDILTGVSFASGGTGFDPLTSKLVSVLSMPDQLELFKKYASQVRAIAGAEKGDAILAEAIYAIAAGNDDIANTYFSTPFRRSLFDIPSYVNMIASYASAFIEELINLGARRIGFVSLPPLGCLPACDPIRNQAAMLFNSKMAEVMRSLSEKYPGRKVVILDIYTSLLDMIERPSSYGFVESTKGCCGTGTIEVTLLCNPLTPITCGDDSKYVFWDSFHPTERAYEVLSDLLLRRYQRELQ